MNQVSPTYYHTFFLISKAYSDTGLRYRDLGLRFGLRLGVRLGVRLGLRLGVRLGLRYVNRSICRVYKEGMFVATPYLNLVYSQIVQAIDTPSVSTVCALYSCTHSRLGS